MGVSCTVNLVDAEPTAEQIGLFTGMIRLMQEDPSEFLIYEFKNPKNPPGVQQGLVFCQMCREEGKILAEMRIDGAEQWRMYEAVLEEDAACGLLKELIRTREAPDLAGWEDITDKVVSDDSEFE